ncbi:MAG: hypothetical protein ACI80V_003129 [Rhodothermales bacterium]|jgi:hypothetical protein
MTTIQRALFAVVVAVSSTLVGSYLASGQIAGSGISEAGLAGAAAGFLWSVCFLAILLTVERKGYFRPSSKG